MKKLYAEKFVTSEDPKLLASCELLKMLFEEGKEKEHRTVHKKVCDILRKSIGINNVIGLGLNEEKTTVGIFIYDIEAKEDTFFDQDFDQTEGKHFILVA